MNTPAHHARFLRVLMITDVYFPRINGVSTSIETFRADLAAEGIQVRLIAPDYPERHNAPATWRVSSRRVPFDPEDRLMHWRALNHTAHRLATEGIDLVHVQTPFAAHYAGLRTARRHQVPVLATYHTHFEEYIAHYLPALPRQWLKAAARKIAASQCNGLDAVVVPSSAMHETLTGYGVTAPLHVLPTGIPVRNFAAGNGVLFRKRHGIAAGRPVALFVGRVAFEKSIDFLIEAMVTAVRHCPELLLVVAGEGPAMPTLRRQAEQAGLGDSIRFVGYLDRVQELPDCYAAADVFAFASRTETQGLVLLEAMAAGLPVFALAAMGTRDILDAQRGAVIAPDDPVAFGNGLATLIGNRYQLDTLSAEARDYALEWAAPLRARQLAGLYRALVTSAA
ncbi:MAG: glycosyltransferase [Rhodocyclaceae bacterium]|nr:glycosyltransferase [Rhodocyclaceae bacterium]MDP1957124.1 glycosyltransferase [Rhodocyclaceae bacterium]